MLRIKRSAGRILVTLFSLVIMAAATLLLFKIVEKKRIIDGRDFFSSIEISLSGNLTYIISSAAQEDRFIIMFFDPDCYYCHVETEALLGHIDEFTGINIYMITSTEAGVLAEFENQYSLADYSRIIPGRISEEIIYSLYGIKAVPSILIYDKTGILLYSNSGYTPVAEIIGILKE